MTKTPTTSTDLGELCTRRQSQPVSTYLVGTWVLGQVEEGQSSSGSVGEGHTKESKGRDWERADCKLALSSFYPEGVGVLSSSCNHFYLILLRIVHGPIYLLSDDALQLWSVYLRRDCILKESITQY